MTTAFLLQDWTTKAGPDSDVEITQSDIGWLDLAGYTDVAFYLSVPFVNVEDLKLSLETAPSKDDNLFRCLREIDVEVTAREQYLNRFASAADEPLARWVRWHLAFEGEGDWKVTFRIWLCATRRGRARRGVGELQPSAAPERLSAARTPAARTLQASAQVDPRLTAPRRLPGRVHLLGRTD